jgi:hypothetical protein
VPGEPFLLAISKGSVAAVHDLEAAESALRSAVRRTCTLGAEEAVEKGGNHRGMIEGRVARIQPCGMDSSPSCSQWNSERDSVFSLAYFFDRLIQRVFSTTLSMRIGEVSRLLWLPEAGRC